MNPPKNPKSIAPATALRAPTRILGVDPGSRRFGWGIIEASGADVRHIASGVFRMPASATLPERLGQLLTNLEALLLDHDVDVVAVEEAFVYKNPRTALVIGQTRGLPIALAAARGLRVMEYQPSTIKRAVVGSGRASKEQVSHMVQLQLGLAALPQEDEGDALAVALTHSRDAGAHIAQVMAVAQVAAAKRTATAAPKTSTSRAYYAAVMAGAKGRGRR